MKAWEQMKKEYREIPIPEQGVHQVMEAMARAKRQKSRERWRKLTCYGTIAAAILIVLLLPGMFFMSGGFGGNTEDNAASVEIDGRKESTGAGFGFDSTGNDSGAEDKISAPMYSIGSSAINNSAAMESNKAEQSEQGGNHSNAGSSNSCMEDKTESPVKYSPMPEASKGELKENLEAKNGFEQSLEAISQEILCQMKVRGEQGEIFYLKSEEYPLGYEKLSGEQEYYINEDGLFVIVFEPGTVAPASAGDVEFVIPAEVAAP